MEEPLQQGHNGTRDINAAIHAASTLDTFAVADLPDAADYAGKLVHLSDGNAGAECLAFSNGTAWKVVTLGAAPAAS